MAVLLLWLLMLLLCVPRRRRSSYLRFTATVTSRYVRGHSQFLGGGRGGRQCGLEDSVRGAFERGTCVVCVSARRECLKGSSCLRAPWLL